MNAGGREGVFEVMFLESFGNVSSSVELPLTDSLCLTNNTVMVSSAGSRAVPGRRWGGYKCEVFRLKY